VHFRYEYDLGPGGLQLTKSLNRRGSGEWVDTSVGKKSCWDLAARDTRVQPDTVPKQAAPAPTQATLNIDSAPSGADIEIDGTFVGDTPSTVSITPGRHEIAIKKKGFNDWNRTLTVTGGAVHLDAELEQKQEK